MAKWEMVFFPPAGERHSPIDALKDITKLNEKALIRRRLDLIRELEVSEWPPWVKIVDKNYQVTAGNYRIYFGLLDRRIIICHICRKVSQKALKSDLDRARLNLKNYEGIQK